VFPCCLVDKCPDDKLKTEQADDHKNDDGDCGACSPFFNCDGCTSTPAKVEPVYTYTVLIIKKPVYTPFSFPAPRDVFYDFWQPPKIG
jgi:hypothetical protein